MTRARRTSLRPEDALVAKRTADGKSRGEIRRCLKWFVARRMYALLEAGPGGLDRSERRPEGVGSLRPVGEILTRMKELPARALTGSSRLSGEWRSPGSTRCAQPGALSATTWNRSAASGAGVRSEVAWAKR